MQHRYNKEKLCELINKTESMGHLLEMLGIIKAGGNYATMNRYIRMWNIDVSHWEKTRQNRQGYKNKIINANKKIPLNEILIKNSTYGGGTYQLKNNLFEEKIFEKKCYNCGLKKWLGKDIPTELEHINGNRFDNRRENLTILCPNCHAFTSTYRRRKIK